MGGVGAGEDMVEGGVGNRGVAAHHACPMEAGSGATIVQNTAATKGNVDSVVNEDGVAAPVVRDVVRAAVAEGAVEVRAVEDCDRNGLAEALLSSWTRKRGGKAGVAEDTFIGEHDLLYTREEDVVVGGTQVHLAPVWVPLTA